MGQLGELTVDVPRENLLVKLRENRANHESAYITAIEGYTETVIEEMEERLTAIKAGKSFDQPYYQPQAPEKHTEEYDEVIEMYEMSPQELVTLSQSDFRQYVRDDWGWKRTWTASNSVYINKAGGSR